jgi:nicotinic acetylcholine receptor
MRNLELKERSSRSLLANVLDIEDDIRGTMGMGMGMGMGLHNPNSASYIRITGNTMDDSSNMHTCLSAQRELQMILKELRYVTGKMKKDDDDVDIISDWKFAAMVVDRFCLIIFTLFTIVATLAVLLTAPHFIT